MGSGVRIRVSLCLHFTNALSYSTFNNNLEPNSNSGFVNKEHNVPAKQYIQEIGKTLPSLALTLFERPKEPSFRVVLSLILLHGKNIERVK